MRRREFLAAAAAPLAAAAAKRPNIILILTDDMGWGDPSCYGNTAVRTPHIDRLAAEGIRFENFYAASAVCTPSRAAILSGRFPLRFDIRKVFPDDEQHLPPVPTLPALLRQAGYATAHIGKWHLGGLHRKHIRDRAHSIPGPHQHGFEHYLCQNEEQPMRREMGNNRTLFRKGGTVLIRNEEDVPPSDPYYNAHFTDIIGDECVKLIERYHREKRPFFLNVWHLAPHQPYEPSPEPLFTQAAAPGITHDQQCYRSMVAHIDRKTGQMLQKLEELGIRQDTLIVFASDNGGAFEANIGPYKGGKTDLHEGGLRVPGIFCWPARIPKGQTTRMIGHHCDLLPTLCAAAGVAPPAGGDGVNLLEAICGKAAPPARGALLWQLDLMPRIQRHYERPKPYATETVRRGKWKLMAVDGRPVALFDLETDPLEDVNLLEKRAETAETLTKDVRAYLTAERDRRGAVK